MKKEYRIRELCGDWALNIPMEETTVVLFFNSRVNAELVKAILEHEDAHPNKAIPYIRSLSDCSQGAPGCHYCLDTGSPRGCPVESCTKKKLGRSDARTNPFDARLGRRS